MTTTFAAPRSGPSYGSTEKTSSAAPATLPDSRAAMRASSSTRSPRRVHDPHAVAHLRDRVRVDRAARLVGQRQVQRQEVGPREHVVEARALDSQLAKALLGDERVVRDDLHLQPERAARDLPTDAAEAEHAEHLVGELDASPSRALPATRDERRVGLRHIAREREQQRERVLGRRDDVRLGGVRDHDPAPRRRVDVDVVDPHSRAADHPEPRPALDQRACHLRRGTDDQRVVAFDDLLERRLAVDVHVEPRAQELDPRIRDRLADEYFELLRRGPSRRLRPGRWLRQAYAGPCRATGDSNASNARATATPRSMSAPSSVSESSTAASALAMSNTSNQPMWPIRKIFPFR